MADTLDIQMCVELNKPQLDYEVITPNILNKMCEKKQYEINHTAHHYEVLQLTRDNPSSSTVQRRRYRSWLAKS